MHGKSLQWHVLLARALAPQNSPAACTKACTAVVHALYCSAGYIKYASDMQPLLMQPSVDGRDPIDEKLYRQLWDLQNAFQHPSSQSEPNAWAEMTTRIRAVLAKLKQEAIGVASTTTAVPQGKSRTAYRLLFRMIFPLMNAGPAAGLALTTM